MSMFKTLEELVDIIRQRKNSTKDKSYTNQLLNNKNLCKEKVEEEIQELLEAISQNKNQVHESADVIYHLLVLLESNNIKIEDVMNELKKRQKKSGLEEKASR
jgi:phosphoribosyl-ATP pyrophosphohydrolase